MAKIGKTAIVIGASMSGLLAARALAEHYDEVIILERDALPESPEPRKGVPQGRHTHGLLARGREALEELFPGVSEELLARGAVTGDAGSEFLWFNHGCYLGNASTGMRGFGVSRPLLEGCVRRRLLQLPNVRLKERCEAAALAYDSARGRVTGLRAHPQGSPEHVETLSADLTVDAGGRGSRSLAWLDALGYAKPREERIKVNIGYVTRLYRRRPEHLPGKFGVLLAACAPDWRIGTILAQEGDRWTVTMAGYLDDQAPSDEAGFIAFARSLPKPEIFDIVRNAEPLSPVMPYMFSANLRRRYEKLSRFPEGYLVTGDALCSFNPVYGQGMTIACLESLALRDCLAGGPARLAGRFFRAASRLIDTPWRIAVGTDLQHPGVEGERTAQVRFVNWYVGKLYRAGRRDEALARRFLEVANLMRRPSALLEPRIALRVWRAGRAAAGSAVVAPA